MIPFTFYVPKNLQGHEVFTTFISDFKALVPLDKLVNGASLKNKILDPTFLQNMLFLSDYGKFDNTSQMSARSDYIHR